MTKALTKIALTDVLTRGRAGSTVVHFAHPWSRMEGYEVTLCDQYEDGRVAHHGTALDVDCMTCLVRANRSSLEDKLAAALHVPKEFLYGRDEEDGADDR